MFVIYFYCHGSLHFPGWHKQFLITCMIINKNVWNKMSPAQQVLVMSVGGSHVLSSYGENPRQQGFKLNQILTANDGDKIAGNDLVLAVGTIRTARRAGIST